MRRSIPRGPESRTFRTPPRKLMADSARLISPFLPLFPSWMINEASIRSLRFANASSRLLRRVAILITNFSLPFSRSIRSRLSDQRRSFLLIDQTSDSRKDSNFDSLENIGRDVINNFRFRGSRFTVHGARIFYLTESVSIRFKFRWLLSVLSESKKKYRLFHLFFFSFSFLSANSRVTNFPTIP